MLKKKPVKEPEAPAKFSHSYSALLTNNKTVEGKLEAASHKEAEKAVMQKHPDFTVIVTKRDGQTVEETAVLDKKRAEEQAAIKAKKAEKEAALPKKPRLV